MSGGQVCAVKGCKSASRKVKMSFFAFPKDVDSARTWAMLCGRDELVQQAETLHNRNSFRICSGHFEAHMFLNDLKNRLKPHAFPSIFPSLEGSSSSSFDHTYGVFTLPLVEMDVERRDPLQELDLNVPLVSPSSVSPPLLPPSSTQTSSSLSSHTPRKEKLRSTIKKLQAEVVYLQNKIPTTKSIVDNATFEDYKLLTNQCFENKELANFLLLLVSQAQKHPKGRRYSDEFKEHCLQIYLMGPKVYKRKLVKDFCLPGPKILQKHLNRLKLAPGINNSLLNTLKLKIDLFKKEDRICTISVDEMTLKSNLFYHIGNDEVIGFEDLGGKKSFTPAHYATVVMVRGVRNNWKQPVAYYFHHTTCDGTKLKYLVETVIGKLQEIGLKVCALVSDMRSNNLQMSDLFNVTWETPYFFVNKEKIIYLFDTPCLLNATRNSLLKYIFVSNDQTARWQHIKQFYDHDKKFDCRSAPKLTDSHVTPTNFEKRKVKYAAQVFSATVAAALNLYIRFSGISPEAYATATLITMMDNLFDLFNSSTTRQGKHFNRAYNGLDFQTNLLNESYKYFDSLRLLNSDDEDVTDKVKFINCWKVNIKGVRHLWEMVRDNLFTRRLDLDCLENFFGKIWQHNGNYVSPTPIQFQRTFKKLCWINLMQSGVENCETDTDSVLLQLTELQSRDIPTPMVLRTLSEPLDTDYHNVDILQHNVIGYISGYLIKKCLEVHSCDTCNKYARKNDELDNTSMLCFSRENENANRDTFGNLCMPDNNFVCYVATLEDVFKRCFEECVTEENVRFVFLEKYSTVKFVHPCGNFPLSYMLNLFFRMRLFFTLKFVNRNLKNLKNKKDRHLIVWRHE